MIEEGLKVMLKLLLPLKKLIIKESKAAKSSLILERAKYLNYKLIMNIRLILNKLLNQTLKNT